MFTDAFNDLRFHAAETMQTPTAWKTDAEGFRSIMANAQLGDYRASLVPTEPFEFLGIKVEVDPSLPPNRVVLRAGQNTVGAFTISESMEQ